MRLLSTRELADALGGSESSLKRWVDAGKIAASRTEGGHRRIRLSDAMRFIHETGTPLARPELLDLPEVAAARGSDRLVSYLLEGDGTGAGGWLIGRYLQGAKIAELGDGPIRDAMHALGELWHHDDRGVFVEHRGTAACLHAVSQLRSMTAAVPANAPASQASKMVVLGAAPAGDPYILPTMLASMTLAEAGLRAIDLGPDTPVAALAHAVAEYRPKLVWISITASLAPARARALARWLASLPSATAIAIGGQHASAVTGLPPRARRLGSMVELAELAAGIKRERAS